MEIILASNNKGKIAELSAMIDCDIKSLDDIGFTEDIEEFGLTFEQNALIKAQTIGKLYPDAIIISDDSGLEVDALDGAPGVYSKRFAGAETDVDSANNALLLEKLEGNQNRAANFRTVLCVYSIKYDLCSCFSGRVDGTIGHELRGENGFGYDPLFVYGDKTFAQLDKAEKNAISHRANALKKLVESGILNV